MGKFGIGSHDKHGTLIIADLSGIPQWVDVTEGRFAYAVRNDPLASCYSKTDWRIDESRKSGARFWVKWLREAAPTNASTPTAQFLSSRDIFICNFIYVVGIYDYGCIARVLKPAHLGRQINIHPTSSWCWGNEDATGELAKPLYWLSTACKDRYLTFRGFSVMRAWGKVTSLDKSVCFWGKVGLRVQVREMFKW